MELNVTKGRPFTDRQWSFCDRWLGRRSDRYLATIFPMGRDAIRKRRIRKGIEPFSGVPPRTETHIYADARAAQLNYNSDLFQIWKRPDIDMSEIRNERLKEHLSKMEKELCA